MGRHDREGDERGLPDGLALQSIAVSGDYNSAKQRKDWERHLAGHQLDPGFIGSWNHPVIAATCQLLLGESNGEWLTEHFSRLASGAGTSREDGTGEYNAYVQACASICMRVAEERGLVSLGIAARAALRIWLCFSSLCTAPGAHLDKPNTLSPDVTTMSLGERTQGRPSTPVTANLARALGLRVDEKKVGRQVWLWPARCFDAGAGASVFSEVERGDLLALIRHGLIAPVLSSPTLGPVFRAIRLRSPWGFYRWDKGGAAVIGRRDNGNSIGAEAGAWGPPEGLRYLVFHPDIRQRVPATVCVASAERDGFTATVMLASGGGEQKRLAVADGQYGRLLWRADIMPGQGLRIDTKGPATLDT